MRKLITVLVFILLATLVTGCGDDQYAIEKRYWNLQKQAQKIFNNPHASPPNELERVIKILENFIQKYPRNRLSLNNEFTIVRLYLVKEEYNKARKQLETILNKYNKLNNICSEAIFLIGNSYELEDKWNLALAEYRKIMQEYPTTLRGFDIPVYIAQHYKIKYQPDKMVQAFQEAVAHYRALAAKFPDSLLGLRASNLVAECYVALKDWQNAVNSFNDIVNNYKEKVGVGNILLNIALIYQRELKDEIKAKETLEKLIKEYPDTRFAKQAKVLLKEWDKK